ncbi:MAG: 3-phosphoglycerate dehydrogenase [Firmicutes bacterium]|nr:3-phosphoglycerate dehydrogenase [Bacillota bacterium]
MKTYIFDPISNEALAYAQSHLDAVCSDSPEIDNYAEVEAVIVRTFKMTPAIIDQMPKLKIIAKHGVGVDNIDIPYAKSKGIRVTNTPDANMNSVAELAIGFAFSCVRRITQSQFAVLNGIEKNSPMYLSGYELSGKTLGLIGLGKIGISVGEKLRDAFSMKVIVYDPFATTEHCNSIGFTKIENLDELCSKGDIISISVPLTEKTKNMITSHELSLMKETAVLINTSRGGIVNEDDLYVALKNNKIFGAALDVFVQEPIQKDHPLLTCENFIATPHNGANTADALIRMGVGAVDEIVRLKNGEDPLSKL